MNVFKFGLVHIRTLSSLDNIITHRNIFNFGRLRTGIFSSLDNYVLYIFPIRLLRPRHPSIVEDAEEVKKRVDVAPPTLAERQ